MHPPQRISPSVVRKQVVVKTPTTVKIVVEPSKLRAKTVVSDGNNAQRKILQVRQPEPPKPVVPQRGPVVAKPHSLVKKINKPAGVRYITADIDGDSLSKIKSVRHRGDGRILVIIGNGPSLNEIDTSELKHLDNVDTMSINKPDARIWPTTHWAFFDQSQFRRHEDLWNGYNGMIFNSTGIKRQKQNSMQIKNLGGKGFSRDLSRGLHIGRSSVYAAMQIGLWMNYHHVYILGCDMNADGIDGKLHFYGVNPDVDPKVRKERFGKEAEYYDFAANVLQDEERKRFTFCSSYNKWGFVDRYNSIDHKNAIELIISHAKQLR